MRAVRQAALADNFCGCEREPFTGTIVIIPLDSVEYDDKLHAYLDDSSTPAEGGLVCSAGYLFEASKAREFRKQWEPYLKSKKIEFFHAKETQLRSDSEEMFLKLAELIKSTALRGFVNFLTPAALQSLDLSIRGYVGSGFSVSTLGCMHMMAEAAKERGKPIVYLVENSQEFGAELRTFFSQIKSDARQVENYAMAFADTAEKRDVIQLQAADLFAWSFTRSHYQQAWSTSVRNLVQDKMLRHTMGSFDPTMMSMIHSFYGMRSTKSWKRKR